MTFYCIFLAESGAVFPVVEYLKLFRKITRKLIEVVTKNTLKGVSSKGYKRFFPFRNYCLRLRTIRTSCPNCLSIVFRRERYPRVILRVSNSFLASYHQRCVSFARVKVKDRLYRIFNELLTKILYFLSNLILCRPPSDALCYDENLYD